MLDQEYDPELYDEWLNDDEQLTRFIKAREHILGKVKGEELPTIQGPQYFEEDLAIRYRVPSRNGRLSVRETGTDRNHAPIGQAQNDGSSDNSREILVSMENIRPEGTEYQYITCPSGEALGGNFHVKHSERIRKYPQWYKL